MRFDLQPSKKIDNDTLIDSMETSFYGARETHEGIDVNAKGIQADASSLNQYSSASQERIEYVSV